MSPSDEQDQDRSESADAMDDATELSESVIKAQTAADDGGSGMVMTAAFIDEEDPYRYL